MLFIFFNVLFVYVLFCVHYILYFYFYEFEVNISSLSQAYISCVLFDALFFRKKVIASLLYIPK